ncbi:vegetative incompatibility protein HET-E-1, partial [Lindgomyces ingoldianus]
MDGLSGAASVIAVIDISAKITSLCFQYSVAVKYAKDDIERVRRKLDDITRVLEKIVQLLSRQDKAPLSTTHGLFTSCSQCLRELTDIKAKLEPGKTRKTMSRIGMRALKWPFTSKEVGRIVSSLEGYEQTFTLALQVDQTGLILDLSQKLDLAKLPTAKGASFNSHNEEHNARCLPNTRITLLRDIAEWARSEDSKPIFWLSGMAGTGKSTIARTVAQSFSEVGQLGASFFFKKGEGECGNASRFFSTIAIDLVACEPGMLPGVKQALDEDSALSERALKDQFEKLILHPLLGIQQARTQALARVVVIDALDECEREEDIQAILQLLARTKDIRPISLRVLVTSRPELPIRFGFKQMSNGMHQDLILHEVPKGTIENDIRLFFEHELGNIQQARMLSSDWPTTDQVQALVELAVPLFIFAATVCRYVSTKGGDPEEYLDKVLQYRKLTFSQLDRTYLPVLDQLFAEQEEEDKETWLHAFQELVGSIVVLRSPLSVASLARLLQVPQKQIAYRLDSLHSVLSIPESKDVPVRLLHLSFREFLVDPRKQGKSPFWVDERSTHTKLASRCLELMSAPSGLRQDVCSLLNPGALRSEMDEGIITSSLPPELQYACRYWVDHLECSQQNITDGDTTHCFLQKHLLHWFEAMSLIKETNQCVHLVGRLQALVASSTSTCSGFLRDAHRFLLRFYSVLADAPLQIYSSALVFAPETSAIRKTFAEQVPQWVEMLSKRETDWDACRSTLNGHSSSVMAMAFSLDSQLVASASDDYTVRLWEAATGTCRSVLEGHSASVEAVAFSPDGQLVASASNDDTVRLWEAVTGACRSVLEGHSRWVTAVAFSPDGQLVASASYDKTVRLWDVATGACCNVLEGHSDTITEVTLSPDGQLVASASDDKTVRLWEAATGTCCSVLEGHFGWVMAVAFSPDGQLVASASDETVRLWEAATGTCRSVLEGHSDTIMAVAFSPDGRLVASASDDKTVRLWEATTGTCRSVLEGHFGWVRTVAFSPDGQLVASASNDKTVRLWEAATGTCRSVLEGHSDIIMAAAFSPDGQLIASASNDRTIRLWEAATRTCGSVLEGHSDTIMAVTFSPDGQLVASASNDNTLRLWEPDTGACHCVLEGHSDTIMAAAFSPDGQLIASASIDITVRLWEAATGTCRSVLEGHSAWVMAVAFSPDRQLVASASFDKTIRLWGVATGTCHSVLQGHSDRVTAVAFSPDGKLVASASSDETVRLWEVVSGTCRRVLESHSASAIAVAFSPDGQLVVLASYNNTVRVWEAATGTCRSVLEVRSQYIQHLAVSLDGRALHTNVGDIPLSSHSARTSYSQDKLPSHILVQDQWILRNNELFLWLPFEYRPTCTAVRGDIVCLGHSSGRVSFLRV